MLHSDRCCFTHLVRFVKQLDFSLYHMFFVSTVLETPTVCPRFRNSHVHSCFITIVSLHSRHLHVRALAYNTVQSLDSSTTAPHCRWIKIPKRIIQNSRSIFGSIVEKLGAFKHFPHPGSFPRAPITYSSACISPTRPRVQRRPSPRIQASRRIQTRLTTILSPGWYCIR